MIQHQLQRTRGRGTGSRMVLGETTHFPSQRCMCYGKKTTTRFLWCLRTQGGLLMTKQETQRPQWNGQRGVDRLCLRTWMTGEAFQRPLRPLPLAQAPHPPPCSVAPATASRLDHRKSLALCMSFSVPPPGSPHYRQNGLW